MAINFTMEQRKTIIVIDIKILWCTLFHNSSFRTNCVEWNGDTVDIPLIALGCIFIITIAIWPRSCKPPISLNATTYCAEDPASRNYQVLRLPNKYLAIAIQESSAPVVVFYDLSVTSVIFLAASLTLTTCEPPYFRILILKKVFNFIY